MKITLPVLLLPLVLLFIGCSTVSDIETGDASIDFSSYDTVVVLDFENMATNPYRKMSHQSAEDAEGTFSDFIAAELIKTGVFSHVSREPVEGRALVISGDITKYKKSRGMFLFGWATAATLDAAVFFRDAHSGAELASVTVDKQKTLRGIGISFNSDTEKFMDSAARTIAKDLAQLKITGAIAHPVGS